MEGIETKRKKNNEKIKDKVKEVANTKAKGLWDSFKDEILQACAELCVKEKTKKGARKHMVVE